MYVLKTEEPTILPIKHFAVWSNVGEVQTHTDDQIGWIGWNEPFTFLEKRIPYDPRNTCFYMKILCAAGIGYVWKNELVLCEEWKEL